MKVYKAVEISSTHSTSTQNELHAPAKCPMISGLTPRSVDSTKGVHVTVERNTDRNKQFTVALVKEIPIFYGTVFTACHWSLS
jgi:hypothetical protein